MAPAAAPAARRPKQEPAPLDLFGAALAGLDEDGLVELFERRPDLAEPPIRHRQELRVRASAPTSVRQALYEADLFTLQVLQALVVLGGPCTVDHLGGVLGPEAPLPEIERALELCRRLLLVAVDHLRRFHAHPTLGQVVQAAGLGPPLGEVLGARNVEELKWVARHRGLRLTGRERRAELLQAVRAALADPEATRRVVAQGPPDAAALAAAAAGGPPLVDRPGSYSLYPTYGRARGRPASNPVEWLAWHGVLFPVDWDTCVMPREVALALRGDRLFPELYVTRPPLEPAGPAVAAGDASALATAAEAVADVEAVVEHLGRAPLKMLKAGGVGVRELRKLAEAADLALERATLVLELGAAAGLIGTSGSPATAGGEVLPTEAYDTWAGLGVGRRWAGLVTAWMASPSFAGLAGTTDGAGKVRPALFDWGPLPMAAAHRRHVLRALAELDPGVAPTRASLLAALSWEVPTVLGLGPADAPCHVAWVLAEAELLGLVHGGALSALGRGVVAGEVDAAAARLAGSVGDAAAEVVLQADLTAVAPSAAPRAWRAQLEAMADVESKGAATVYRFTEASVRRALDSGRSAGELLSFLEAHAAKGVPQPLAYLVDDVARRHGRTRVGGAVSYVRFEDEAAATEVLRSRKVAGLGLRRIAPTVLVSGAAPAKVLAALRAARQFPAQEDATGALVVPAAERRRLGGQRGGWAPAAPTVLTGGSGGTAAWRDTARRLLSAGDGPVAPPAAGRAPLRVVGGGDLRRRHGGERAGRRSRSPARPAVIGRDRDTVWDIVELALERDWMVRVALRRDRQAPAVLDAMVTGFEDGRVLFFSMDVDDDGEVEVALSRIAWIRVLTEEEEEML
jgi:hypothetical protein